MTARGLYLTSFSYNCTFSDPVDGHVCMYVCIDVHPDA